MQFRHEVKLEITKLDMIILRSRLKFVMKTDPYAKDGLYEIRSLYFDTADDRALREKIDGVSEREKYRIRMYNGDMSVIKLERKYKKGGLGYKESALLTLEQAKKTAVGDIAWMAKSENETLLRFYTRMQNGALKPKTVVDYTREPFVFPAGDVRVTLDYNIRTSLGCTDFLNENCVTVPVAGSPCIMEVKWNEFLPDTVRDAIALDSRQITAYSKYASARMYD